MIKSKLHRPFPLASFACTAHSQQHRWQQTHDNLYLASFPGFTMVTPMVTNTHYRVMSTSVTADVYIHTRTANSATILRQ